jgi:hypothetical protein
VPYVSDSPAGTHGLLRCTYWHRDEHRRCDQWLWWIKLTGGGVLVTEVSAAEHAHLRGGDMTPTEVLLYLSFPAWLERVGRVA